MKDQLGQMKHDSDTSSKQFTVQLQHFDASLGVNQVQLGKLDASITEASRLATATEKANANVIAADRPYIWIDYQESEPLFREPPDAGSNAGLISRNMSFKNFGKSPAFKVRSTGYISINVFDLEDDSKLPPLISESGGIYPPGDRFFKTFRSLERFGPNVITRNGTENPEGAAHISIHAFIEYFDRSGNRYTSEVCEIIQPDGVGKRCKNHNEIK